MTKAITTSIFELFKIGPGPSSSHTIGPMKAGYDFTQSTKKLANSNANNIKVHLYGSLSATGKGHGTNRAVLAGLLGNTPENCNPKFFDKLLRNNRSYDISIGNKIIRFSAKDIIFEKVDYKSPHSNTLTIQLKNDNKTIFEKEYYSTGGGFLDIKDENNKKTIIPKYKYSNMAELIRITRKENLPLHKIVFQNEKIVSGLSNYRIYEGIKKILNVMLDSVERGLHTKGVLPGNIKLDRKASDLFKSAKLRKHKNDNFLVYLNALALAVSEENAAGHFVVTAPTSGSAGVIPALLYMLKHYYHVTNIELCKGLLCASAIGFIIKHNASISGAEVGCQGEIGTAAAMGAALCSEVRGYNIDVIANSAEIALEHHLGLTCDPIGGFVQIPCIERNAVGAVSAYNAYLLASSCDPNKQKIKLDDVIKVMLETGKDMSCKYKETSKGGLALSMPVC